MNLTLIYPMFVLVFFTFLIMAISLYARIEAVKSGAIPVRFFKTFEGAAPPEFVTKTTRHFTNLFEVPVLYYAGLIIAMILPLSGFWIQFWAWFFVVARIVQAVIHIGPNKIRPRMISYALGWFAVLSIWILILIGIQA